jgi:hypothetical protein
MNEEQTSKSSRPWHLWLVGILSILWNSIGCLDFTMVNTRNADYLEAAGFSAEQMDFFYSYPFWANAVWGIAVWSAMLGGLLLLARKRLAVPVYLTGLITYVGAMIRQYGFTEFSSLFPEAHYGVMSLVIFVLAIAQLYYARRMRDKGVLS